MVSSTKFDSPISSINIRRSQADWDNRDYVPENEPVQHKQHHPRHQQQQQQYEGEDGPGPQYENRSNQAGGYGPGGGPGANQDL